MLNTTNTVTPSQIHAAVDGKEAPLQTSPSGSRIRERKVPSWTAEGQALRDRLAELTKYGGSYNER